MSWQLEVFVSMVAVTLVCTSPFVKSILLSETQIVWLVLSVHVSVSVQNMLPSWKSNLFPFYCSECNLYRSVKGININSSQLELAIYNSYKCLHKHFPLFGELIILAKYLLMLFCSVEFILFKTYVMLFICNLFSREIKVQKKLP